MRAPAALVLLSAALLAGCASGGPKSSSDPLGDALRARGLDPSTIVNPFAVDAEMVAWARGQLLPGASERERLQALLESLVNSRGLAIEYQSDYTATAAEVFRERRANCLAFTHLVVGLARALGMDAYFLAVQDLQRFSKEGDLVIVSGHMTAGFGQANDRLVLEFTAAGTPDYHVLAEISDLAAIAKFYSNRGAHALRAGKLAEATDWLRQAVAIDPETPEGWINYGVALRRGGRTDEAEKAYRRALEVDAGATSAYHNLAALLRLRGQDQEASELLTLVDRRSNRNPFSYLSLGDLSLRFGRLEEAGRFYRRALRLGDPAADAELMAAMGMFELRAGRPAQARRWLKRARGVDPQNSRVVALERSLSSSPPSRPTGGRAG
jgi:Flp pilus assembly protein TadD